MSLITLKLQEASVFIIISAKVSVMNLECSWETSVRNRARDEDERHHLFYFSFICCQSPAMTSGVKWNQKDLEFYMGTVIPPILWKNCVTSS